MIFNKVDFLIRLNLILIIYFLSTVNNFAYEYPMNQTVRVVRGIRPMNVGVETATIPTDDFRVSSLAKIFEGIDTKLVQATRETGTTFSFDPKGKNNDVSTENIDRMIKLGAIEVTFNPYNLATWIATDTTGEAEEIIKHLLAQGITDPKELLFKFTKIKVGQVAERLRPIWDATDGRRGCVSVEHDPTIEAQVAMEMQGATPQEIEDEIVRRIMEEVRELHKIAPNVLVKIRASRNGINPFTGKKDMVGLRVLEEATALGIHTNYTVVTALEQAIEAGRAVLRGKKRARQAGIARHIESRISPFLSRVDGYTKVHREDIAHLYYAYGLAGMINGYQIVHGLFEEFGPNLPQTPIISSVGVKTPDLVLPWAYMYAFVGARYVITAPAQELAAYENAPIPVEATILKPLEDILADRLFEFAPNLAERAHEEGLTAIEYVQKAIAEWNTLPEKQRILMLKVLDKEGDETFTIPYLRALDIFKQKIEQTTELGR